MIDSQKLKRVAALSTIDEPALAELAAHARTVSVPAGSRIAGDHERARAPLVIESGTAWLLRHGHRVANLGPRDLLTHNPPPNASLVAATPMRLILLRPQDLRSGAVPPDRIEVTDSLKEHGV